MHRSSQRDGSAIAAIKLLAPLAAIVCLLFLLPSSASATGTIAVTSGPGEGGTTKEQKVSFGLSYVTSVDKDVDFFCSMDNADLFQPCQNVAFPACTSNGATKTCTQTSRDYLTLTQRSYTFRVFASECDSPCSPFDEGIDGPIVSRTFTVDRVAPIVTLVSGPSVAKPVIKGKPTFVVTTNEPASLRCSEDGGTVPISCASPITLDAVGNGRHSLAVTALDFAGNTSAPLVIQYKVDVFKPKRCKKGKSKKAKAKYAKCKKANARAKALWKKRNR